MKLTRDKLFDWIEMVGRAIANSKEKPAPVKDWSLMYLFSGDPDSESDEWGVISECGWKTPRQKKMEREARQMRRDSAFYVSADLCDLQRKLRFKDIGIRDAYSQLLEIIERADKLISKAWKNQLRRLLGLAS